MADVISILASTALIKLSSSVLRKLAFTWHLESELDRLTGTMTTIKEVLDAHDGSQIPGHRNLIERLRDAVYDTDDLLDKITTSVERKRIMAFSYSHGRFIKEVRFFFSGNNQIATRWAISGEIRRIRKTLDDIVGDRTNFSSMFPSRQPAEPSGDVIKGRETCSSVVIEEVIGRDEDKKKILDDLLRYDPRDDPRKPHVEVLTIVGTGGLGKTTLAQLAFNDEDVKSHFELMEWVYIGDELDVKVIIRMLVTPAATEGLSLEQIQYEFRKKMGGKKYLLVLDDVWEENLSELLRLTSLLSVGEKGSRVLVTTRNMYTARSIGTTPPLDLKVLSNDDAWKLFASVALGQEERQKDPYLVQILGQEIAKKCGNLPLAIKVIASLLRGKDEKEWWYFKDHDLASIDSAAGNGIMPLLKLSYSRLRPQLKQCFLYCSLFPKDSVIDRIKICHLWMAEGFIIISASQHPGASPEDVANQYFMELLHRCFFKNIQQDNLRIKSFKMHDLMHELAQDVAREAIIHEDRGGHRISSVTRRTRHLSIPHGHASSTPNFPSTFLDGGKQLRTFLQLGTSSFESPPLKVCDFISKFQSVRVLDLHCMKIEQLPESIGRLIHLRYLDLSGNCFKRLPTSFTSLHNLETLDLNGCSELKELPRDLSKLVNLQNLNIESCSNLARMPSGMGSLTCLRRLTTFVVGFGKSDCTACSPKPHTIDASGFDDLMLLENLRGSLDIVIDRQGSSDGMPAVKTTAGCLLNKSHLTGLQIHMRKERNLSGEGSEDEELLECLQPHSNVSCLRLSGNYRARKFPSWMSMNNLASVLPNLVGIELSGCERCQHLPILSQLPSLESLVLCDLRDVEYVESNYGYDQASTSATFFPCLQSLKLRNLRNVKGWWKSTGFESTELGGYDHEGQHRAQPPPPSFHRLSELYIEDCPNMTSVPLCPSLERLELSRFNSEINFMETEELNSAAVYLSDPSKTTPSSTASMLRYLTVDNTDYLNHLPKSCLHSLTQLHIINEGRESGLLCGSIVQHLTALEALKFWECNAHFQEEDAKEAADEMPWRSLRRLRSLDFYELPNLRALPKWIEYLTGLEELSIRCCGNLEELPGWISRLSSSLRSLMIMNCSALKALPQGVRDLTSLRFLSLEGCGGLAERCRKPNGEDWPKIRHIPKIKLPDGQIVEQRRFHTSE